ncbi:MAG TPA: sugar ABC transporter permease [Candidatus Didemnitutus sp.]|nr:sugar ABC transporter permease [Candidatus Didemnitutus sp.]
MTAGERQKLKAGLSFVSPWLLGFAIFTIYPVVASLYFSFCDYDVLTKPVWVGTLNYQDMISDRVFWQSVGNTIVFNLIALPLGLVSALALALLLNQPIRLRGAFRAIYYLPSLVPAVAGAMVWLWILNGRLGLLNRALFALGVAHPPQWLLDPAWTKPSLALVSLWGCGNTVVIYLAALQGVPRSLLEAAMIDGASAWDRLRHVTLPAISPVIYFNLLIGIIGGLQVFSSAFVMMGGGGPERSVLFYAIYIYQNAFEYRHMGYASAMAWILCLLILALTWLASRASRHLVHYQTD